MDNQGTDEASCRKRESRRLAKAEATRLELEAEQDDSSLWTLVYGYEGGMTIKVTEDWSGDGNGIAGLQWLGGVLLSRYLDSREIFSEDFFRGKRVIEVGAGIGLTGIYVAKRGADVLITDMDTEKCMENVESNLHQTPDEGRASIAQLVWAETDVSTFSPPFDMILAGDCMYEIACVEPLMLSMWQLAGPDTLVLVCGVVGDDVMDVFLATVDRFFLMEKIPFDTVDTLSDMPELKKEEKRGSATESARGMDAAAAAAAGGGGGGGGGGEQQRPGTRGLFRLAKRMEILPPAVAA